MKVKIAFLEDLIQSTTTMMNNQGIKDKKKNPNCSAIYTDKKVRSKCQAIFLTQTDNLNTVYVP